MAWTTRNGIGGARRGSSRLDHDFKSWPFVWETAPQIRLKFHEASLAVVAKLQRLAFVPRVFHEFGKDGVKK